MKMFAAKKKRLEGPAGSPHLRCAPPHRTADRAHCTLDDMHSNSITIKNTGGNERASRRATRATYPDSHTHKTHALVSSDPKPQEPRRAPPPPSLAGALLYDDVVREGHAADRAAARGREGLLRLLVEQPQPLPIEQPRLEPRPRVESAPVARMQPQRLPKRGARPLDVVVGVEHRPEQRVQRRVAGRGPEPLAQRRARVCAEALPREQHRLQLVRPPASAAARGASALEQLLRLRQPALAQLERSPRQEQPVVPSSSSSAARALDALAGGTVAEAGAQHPPRSVRLARFLLEARRRLPERRVAAAAAQPVRVDPPRLLHLAQPRLHHAPCPPRPPVPRLLRDGPPEELSRRLVLLQARPREAGAEKEGRGAGRAGEAALKRLERVVPAALPQPHRPERVPRPRAVVCTPATEPRRPLKEHRRAPLVARPLLELAPAVQQRRAAR
mmetsp:Transcript_47364/g.157007  ORF Transcript_47364/g.157007 Transcript_47364/m.157007 type:complete len:445 (-) Transcript_47364:827-2161(-)